MGNGHFTKIQPKGSCPEQGKAIISGSLAPAVSQHGRGLDYFYSALAHANGELSADPDGIAAAWLRAWIVPDGCRQVLAGGFGRMTRNHQIRPIKAVALACIWFYQKAVSGFLPPSCRFRPTCSDYAREVIQRFGVVRGGWLTIRRLLRCHPFYKGPLFDPPPDK